MFLSGIEKRPIHLQIHQFPWSLPLFASLEKLEFRAPITFLVGENGSGKSTLLEGLAVGIKAIAAGSQDLDRDETLWAAHEFARAFRFIRRRNARRTMFLRAEDVLGYTSRAARLSKEAAEALRDGFAAARATETEEDQVSREESRPGTNPADRLERQLKRKYLADPFAQSHGETFLELLRNRLKPNGLYLLDEPETPLSPTRVLALLLLIRERAASNCQFIIATHSPILMAIPESEILLLDNGTVESVAYETVEHVRVTKAFLKDPSRFMRRLLM